MQIVQVPADVCFVPQYFYTCAHWSGQMARCEVSDAKYGDCDEEWKTCNYRVGVESGVKCATGQ